MAGYFYSNLEEKKNSYTSGISNTFNNYQLFWDKY